MFGRKKKKRRDNQYVPDVKKRSGPMRALRLRMAVTALAVSASLVLCVFVFWKGSDFVLEQFVYTNPAFAIDHIEISTDGIIPVDQLRRWAGVKVGDNLIALDLARVKRDLEYVPLIESASVERVLPRQLVIKVIEREPIAKVSVYQARASDSLMEASTYFMDRQGMLMPPLARAFNPQHFDAATRDLPAMTGIPGAELRPGHKTEHQQTLAGLDWIDRFRASDMLGVVDVRSIDVSSPNTLVVSTGQGAEITFASVNLDMQISRWQKIHDFARRGERLLASLDLAVTNYVPASWQDSTGISAPSIKPAKPSPYKKRHV
jgi:hypothetical protein